MKNKSFFLGLILVTALFIVSSVSATATINTPAASGVVGCGANTAFNVTTTGWNDPVSLVNLTFYAKSASTANSSWSVIGTSNALNFTSGGNHSITNINLTGQLEDANNYIFNVTIKNETGGNILEDDTNTGITVDCTIPVAPTIGSHTESQVIKTSGTQTFTGTVTDAKTTGCTYTIARGGATAGDDYTAGTSSYSTTTCSFTKAFSSSTDNGNWYIQFTATDGTNTTASSVRIISVAFPGSGGGLPGGTATNPLFQGNNLWVVGIIGAILVSIVIYIAIKRK